MPALINPTIFGDNALPVEALPAVTACATHLRLLEAFVALGESVQFRARHNGADPDTAWSAFVDHSVLRFFKWFRSTGDGPREALPPLDVLMVWHAFMLNPRTYANFCERIAKDHGPGVERIPWATATMHSSSGIFWQYQTQTEDLTSPVMSFAEHLEAQAANQLRTETDSFAMLLSDNLQFDLGAAVHRQRRFALKMARFGWVHSPVAHSILARAVNRYGKFLSLFAAQASQQGTASTSTGDGRVAMVPALDIDLVWHTHQLSPAHYRAVSATVTGGRLVNHNDFISDFDVRTGFKATAQLYRDRFNEEYDLCNSWFCQVARLRQCGTKGDTALPLSTLELCAIQNMAAACASQRKRQMGLSVELDLAGCQCHAIGAAKDASSEESSDDGSAGCNECSSSCSSG